MKRRIHKNILWMPYLWLIDALQEKGEKYGAWNSEFRITIIELNEGDARNV